jgi:hypothetical protein
LNAGAESEQRTPLPLSNNPLLQASSAASSLLDASDFRVLSGFFVGKSFRLFTELRRPSAFLNPTSLSRKRLACASSIFRTRFTSDMKLFARAFLTALSLAGAFFAAGCTSKTDRDTSIPWSRPAGWEGQVPGMGSTPGSGR